MKKGMIFILLLIVCIGSSIITMKVLTDREKTNMVQSQVIESSNIYTNIKDSKKIAIVSVAVEVKDKEENIIKIKEQDYIIRDVVNKCVSSMNLKELNEDTALPKLKNSIKVELLKELDVLDLEIFLSDFVIG